MLSEEYVLNSWMRDIRICPHCGSKNVEFVKMSSYDIHCEIWQCDDCENRFQVWLQVCNVFPL